MAARGEFVVVRQSRKVGWPDKKQSEEEEEGGGRRRKEEKALLRQSSTYIDHVLWASQVEAERQIRTESSSFGLSLACKGHQICGVAEIQHHMV